MTTLLQDVASCIAAIVPAEASIFPSNFEPPSPDNCLTLYSTGGPQGTLSLDGDVQSQRSVQLRLRDASQGSLQTRCEALYEAFKVWQAYPAAYLQMRAFTQPTYNYPRDDNNRSIASFNVWVIRGSHG